MRYNPRSPCSLLSDVNDGGQSTTALLLYVVVGCVAVDVAMEQPLAWLASSPDHIVSLTRRHVHGVFLQLSASGNRIAVGSDDGKGSAMDVHRVRKGAAAADKPEADFLTDGGIDRIGGGVSLAIDGEEVG